MQYTTIMLALLQEYPSLYDPFRTSGTLLQTLNHSASDLKERHTAWRQTLSQTQPGRHLSQIASQALELALHDLQDFLPAASSPNAGAPEASLSLDAARRFPRHPTPPV